MCLSAGESFGYGFQYKIDYNRREYVYHKGVPMNDESEIVQDEDFIPSPAWVEILSLQLENRELERHLKSLRELNRKIDDHLESLGEIDKDKVKMDITRNSIIELLENQPNGATISCGRYKRTDVANTPFHHLCRGQQIEQIIKMLECGVDLCELQKELYLVAHNQTKKVWQQFGLPLYIE